MKENNDMKNLEVLEAVLKVAEQFRVHEIDERLFKSISETTETLVNSNPSLSYSDVYENLKSSTRISAGRMIETKDFDNTVDMIVGMANSIADEEDDPMSESDQQVLRQVMKTSLVKNMLANSFYTSCQAIESVMGGKK